MSTFSHTDWTVICDYRDEDGGCMQYGRTDELDLRDGSTATAVRKVLKHLGWAVAVPTGRERRADFCPEHKAAGMAQIEEAGR